MTKEFKMIGMAKSIALKDLRLDAKNPRLVSSKAGESQIDLAVNIEMAHESIVIAESIARNGFFANEPLIVIKSEVDSSWIVVEGNRRLTALQGLAFPEIRQEFFQFEQWEILSTSSNISPDSPIPCVEITDRRQVSSIIGFRHISGILDWTPYAQASYISHLVEDEEHTFLEVSQMIGKKRNEVANLYRNYSIARQASAVGIPSTELEGAFSLLTVAMSSPHLRDHIGAPSGSSIQKTKTPIPPEKVPELRELIGWVFDSEKGPAVIDDSRQLSALGRIVGNPNGLKALRGGAKTIAAAEMAIESPGMDPLDRLRRHLNAALSALRLASDSMDFGIDNATIMSLIGELEDEIYSLRQLSQSGDE